MGAYSSAQSSISLNIPVLTDLSEMVNGASTNSQVNTSQTQPSTLRARTGTLQRAATVMFTHKPLAPPPTILQSLKAILVASCLSYFFVTRELPSECALGLNILLLCIPVSVCIQPDFYELTLIYSSNSGLCTLPCPHRV